MTIVNYSINVSEDSETVGDGDQSRHDLLRFIFGGGSQKVLKLERPELLDDLLLLQDALLIGILKLVETPFLLVNVLDQFPASIMHLSKTDLKT